MKRLNWAHLALGLLSGAVLLQTTGCLNSTVLADSIRQVFLLNLLYGPTGT